MIAHEHVLVQNVWTFQFMLFKLLSLNKCGIMIVGKLHASKVLSHIGYASLNCYTCTHVSFVIMDMQTCKPRMIVFRKITVASQLHFFMHVAYEHFSFWKKKMLTWLSSLNTIFLWKRSVEIYFPHFFLQVFRIASWMWMKAFTFLSLKQSSLS